MQVSGWAVLGGILVALGLPLAWFYPLASFVVGAGVAFGVVAVVERSRGDLDESPDASSAEPELD